ncbi:MAG TPA: hypothetical protein VNA69_03355 [Thermoanaerobaculia bacterium]|nr:hypothetical protein [Thermoanaerobaculia bacterium]
MPVLIGAVLVVIAALAVVTGLRYREDTLTDHVPPQRERTSARSPQDEPGAGASLVMPESTPEANEPMPGQSRAVISGGPEGIESATRMFARRGMLLNVLPDDAMVSVNDVLIGQVRQFNSMDEVYDFAEPGSYTVRIAAPSGVTKTFIVTVSDDAKVDIARISARL